MFSAEKILRILFVLFSAAALVAGAAGSILELRAHMLHQHALEAARSSPKTEDQGAAQSEADSLKAAKRSSAAWLAVPGSEVHYAALLQKEAQRTQDQSRRISLYCEALSELGTALHQTPKDARILVNWANIRQLLGDYDCSLGYTEGDYSNAVTTAVQYAPADMEVQYAAGLISVWGGKAEEGWAFFNTVLKFDPNLSPSRRHFIFSLITSPGVMRAVLPPTFPQVLQYSIYFAGLGDRGNLELKSTLRGSLAQLQSSAIQTSSGLFESGEMPYSVHFQHLSSLSGLCAGSEVRQELDAALALLLERKQDLKAASYLKERAGMRELKIIRAAISSDSRPLKTPLARWNRNESVYFDDAFNTVGFYLSENQTPRMIELTSKQKPDHPLRPAIQLLTSSNNQNWSEAGEQIKIETVEAGNEFHILIRIPPEYHKYWKVHFSSSNKDRTFSHELNSILRVYGISYDREG